ncbi:MAG TPA: carbonic anhydrase [Terriglobia bacterium]|nr:carbonic anhydrase [Terriglobia bacterium]
MDILRCQALVLTCFDFRLHRKLAQELRKIGVAEYDLKSDAGGVKYLVSPEKPAVRAWFLENIHLACRLHGVERVLLVSHNDCKAYGGDDKLGTLEEQVQLHRRELDSAKQIIEAACPALLVEKYFAVIEGKEFTLRKL